MTPPEARKDQGLAGLRVLELGERVSSAYTTKLLADLGADVVKAEPPGGDPARRRGPYPGASVDPERSGLFLALHTNKRGIHLDLPHERERLRRLVAWADVVVHDHPPGRMRQLGIHWDAFHEIQPSLVLCSVTAFGLTGPHRDHRAEELTLAHGGGWGYLGPGALEIEDAPPLKAWGHQAELQTGVAAATATLAAVYAARATGRGEHVDLSVQAYVASFLEQAVVHYTYGERVASRFGQKLLYPWGIYECSDGLIFLCIIEEDQWQRLVDLMGRPEWARLEIFRNTFQRHQNWDALKLHLEEWTRGWTVRELYERGQERRICFAPVLTLEEMSRQDHLAQRGFFVDVEHRKAGRLRQLGAPYRLSKPWWRIRRGAPSPGEHDEEVSRELDALSPRSRPAREGDVSPRPLLDGVRVVDLSWVWAGPFCTLHLAHLGAEVIKVESGRRLDAGRRLPIFPKDVEGGPNRTGYFNQWGQGKKSVLVDLQHQEGVGIVKELVARSDIVVENFATGVAERLGLGFDALREVRPDLIMASISGYGHTGPRRDYMAYGPAIAPLAGLSSLTGYIDDAPREVGISYGNPNGGIHAAAAIAAALVARQESGEGVHIDLSLWEAMAVLQPEAWMDVVMNGRQPERMGNRDPLMAPHGCYRCSGEDAWVAIACSDDDEWTRLCRVIGRDELSTDPRFETRSARKRHEDELDALISGWTSHRTPLEATRALQGAEIAAAPSRSARDLLEDPQLLARDLFVRLPHPEVGEQTHVGIPWRLARAPDRVRSAAPLLGQHTDEVLEEIGGYTKHEIEKLRQEGVLE